MAAVSTSSGVSALRAGNEHEAQAEWLKCECSSSEDTEQIQVSKLSVNDKRRGLTTTKVDRHDAVSERDVLRWPHTLAQRVEHPKPVPRRSLRRDSTLVSSRGGVVGTDMIAGEEVKMTSGAITNGSTYPIHINTIPPRPKKRTLIMLKAT